MKLKSLSTSKLTLQSPIRELYARPTKTLEKLAEVGILSIEELLWILPRKVMRLPSTRSFEFAELGDYFRGHGKVISIHARPNFKARGRGRAVLLNITAIIQDTHSDNLLSLRWFNCYSSIQKKIESLESIEFLGVVSEFNEQLQITNPDFNSPEKFQSVLGLKIQYPTINSISTLHFKKVIDKIPQYIWDDLPEILPSSIVEENSFLCRSMAFKYLHAKIDAKDWEENKFQQAKMRLIYEEFFLDQIKLELRKTQRGVKPGIELKFSSKEIQQSKNLYSYELTRDQETTLSDVVEDLASGSPMMRLVQGDVGCGKTTIAVLACFLTVLRGYQAALMCPTESLALQHYESLKEVLPTSIKLALLIGSISPKEKKATLERISSGEAQITIGTHALFQDSVTFKSLALSIIDEQHKFGVEQRQKLIKKGSGSHCLIMSATPIPRSLSLTQYGDLDISIIKTMPAGRKGSKTRIVTPQTFDKFLSFLKTRISMGEQAYILVPAINESENQNIIDLQQTVTRFKQFFPEYKIASLHGQMHSSDKAQVFADFSKHKIDLLVATSVIEVGINILNSTIMAILNPERFGLSSLHQMRGRVGRGQKPGFCFLIIDRKLSPESMHRLQVIEQNSDGFKIAEEDLKIRGEGDLFGADQSGIVTMRRIADLVLHQDVLYKVIRDFKGLSGEKCSKLATLYETLQQDPNIFNTI